MNIQKIFDAVRNGPDQPTIIIAIRELEKQGYIVIVNDRYNGTKDLILADEMNELQYLYKLTIAIVLDYLRTPINRNIV